MKDFAGGVQAREANPLTGNGDANFIAEISCKFVKGQGWHSLAMVYAAALYCDIYTEGRPRPHTALRGTPGA
jgi:hypothetical protein